MGFRQDVERLGGTERLERRTPESRTAAGGLSLRLSRWLRGDVTPAPLSEAVRSFLAADVGSVERLDLLLFLHRQAQRWWSAQSLAGEHEMPADTVQLHLEHLGARNLLDVRIADSVVYRYTPGREELAELVEEAARANYLHRDAVAAVLAPRLADSARLFADAFQLRKGKPDG